MRQTSSETRIHRQTGGNCDQCHFMHVLIITHMDFPTNSPEWGDCPAPWHFGKIGPMPRYLIIFLCCLLTVNVYGSTTLGDTATIRGFVRELPSLEIADGVFGLITVDGPVKVDARERRKEVATLVNDCEIEIKVYLSESEYLYRGDGLTILSRPSWWDLQRASFAAGFLLVVAILTLIWNRILKNQVERRGQELLKERLASSENRLKVEERTRLAVELHDSLAQNLAGVSMELSAKHVDSAQKMLKVCRSELRNCLWDLRSRALEETDMKTAIQRMLLPTINDSRLSVRFNVPRNSMADNSAHALMRAVRELVNNAINHGHASSIRVAGELKDGWINCSIADNGQGFDTSRAPGASEGHFGLQGIRERISRLNGQFSIVSTPGNGTKARLSIPCGNTQ